MSTEHYRASLAKHDPELLEQFEERAAIREYDGREPREKAEAQTYLALCKRRGIRPEKPPRKP